MRVEDQYRGRAYVEYTVYDIPNNPKVSDDFLIGYVFGKLDDDPTRFFGYHIHRWPMTTTATVTLHTD